MVAVAAHQVFELRQAFGVRRHHAGFVEHQHAQFIGGIQEFRGGRIVRRPQRVAAHFLQLAHAEILHRIGQRSAHAGVVLMVASAFQLDGFAIEEEALLGIEGTRADSERRLVPIGDSTAVIHLGDQLV